MKIDRARPGEAEAIAEMHVAAWRETYPDLLPPSMFAQKTVAGMTPRWHDSLERGEAVFVVRNGAAIVGVAMAGTQRDAELPFSAGVRTIYLLRAAQGLGLGRGLMAAMAEDLLARGLMSCSLWALGDNATARRFYERLGGRVILTKPEIFPDGEIEHVAYGWDNVSAWLIRPPAAGSGE